MELSSLPIGKVDLDKLPESLRYFIQTSNHLCLDRKLVKNIPEMKLSNQLKKGMCPKKIHECSLLSSLILEITKKIGIETVIDIGAGKGYLSQCLHFLCDLEVISIDSSAFHSENAEKRKQYITKKTEKEIKKNTKNNENKDDKKNEINKKNDNNNYIFKNKKKEKELSIVTKFISPQISENEFKEMIFPHINNKSKDVLITSLHSCGDLSTSSMKMANNFETIKAFVGVGCCYHKISALNDPLKKNQCGNESDNENDVENDSEKKYSFPFSNYCQSEKSYHLGSNALQTACQSVDQYPIQKNVDLVFKKTFLQIFVAKSLGQQIW
eukprot:TRINITY_DN7699_c0_g1_i2.p1 TRINITY_DN7699_c0_g1~~TRINITY_DN7699_c0_g1_i2.p1  ORF type:complete len:326 (-),score=89.83 TRINITY_DN7699_c0_g1_i2:169-1146(-)